MEFDYMSEKPLVRIGSLQSEKKMKFTAHVPFDIFSLDGDKIMSGIPGKEYEVFLEESQPAEIRPMIRLAISYDHNEAQALVKKWEEKKLTINLIRVGENTQICKDRYIDNREYWVLATGFSSFEIAEKKLKELDDFGSYKIFQVPEKPANGSLLIEDHKIADGIRLVPQEDVDLPFTLHNVLSFPRF